MRPATVLVAALLLAAACAPVTVPEPPGVGVAASVPAAQDASAAPAGGPGTWLLPGTLWRLVELDGAPFAAQATAELTPDGRIAGQAPCNRYDATWTGRWPEISFSPVAATRMACDDLKAETAFFDALRRVTRAELGGAGLVLTGPEGTRLRFQRVG